MSLPRIEKPFICLHSFLSKQDFTGFDDHSGFTGGRSHTVLTIVPHRKPLILRVILAAMQNVQQDLAPAQG